MIMKTNPVQQGRDLRKAHVSEAALTKPESKGTIQQRATKATSASFDLMRRKSPLGTEFWVLENVPGN